MAHLPASPYKWPQRDKEIRVGEARWDDVLLVHHDWDAKKGCYPTAIALSPGQDPNLGIGSRRCPVGHVALKQSTAGPGISPIYLL